MGGGGKRGSGGEPWRGSGGEGGVGGGGLDFLSDFEPGFGAFQVGETHRVTVHGAVVHGRHVHRRAPRGREYPAGRRKRRHHFGFRDGTRAGEKLFERFVDVEKALVHLNPL